MGNETEQQAFKAAIAQGDIARVRELLFWGKEKIELSWENLKVALHNSDEPMVRLLATWGAPVPNSLEALYGLPHEKLTGYGRILRRYGLDASVFEQVAASPADVWVMPGTMVPSEGIYLCQYNYKSRDENSLSKIFNVFAAPEGLPETMKYIDAVKCVAQLKNWHGYDGVHCATDEELHVAIDSHGYNGSWIIPPHEVMAEICSHQDRGAFKDTFKSVVSKSAPGYPSYSGWYWSSTKKEAGQSPVRIVRLSGPSFIHIDIKDYGVHLSCRPVRLVELKNR